MFDNVNWNELINNVLIYVKKWNYLIIKADISKSSYSTKFYYSKEDKTFLDLYSTIDGKDRRDMFNSILPNLKKISEQFKTKDERLFFTVKVESNGNVKVIYRKLNNGNKLPDDEGINYLELNKNDMEQKL